MSSLTVEPARTEPLLMGVVKRPGVPGRKAVRAMRLWTGTPLRTLEMVKGWVRGLLEERRTRKVPSPCVERRDWASSLVMAPWK